MSRRKAIVEKLGQISNADLKRRTAEEIAAQTHVLGYPERPQGCSRRFRVVWNEFASAAFARRVLAKDDGQLLEQLVNAKLVGDNNEQYRIAKIFLDREPLPEPPVVVLDKRELAIHTFGREFVEFMEAHPWTEAEEKALDAKEAAMTAKHCHHMPPHTDQVSCLNAMHRAA